MDIRKNMAKSLPKLICIARHGYATADQIYADCGGNRSILNRWLKENLVSGTIDFDGEYYSITDKGRAKISYSSVTFNAKNGLKIVPPRTPPTFRELDIKKYINKSLRREDSRFWEGIGFFSGISKK